VAGEHRPKTDRKVVIDMIRFLKAAVYLLVTTLDMGSGPSITLTDGAVAPANGHNLGTCLVDGAGYSILTIKTGTGPTELIHFVGYWTQSGGN
jgi:hypothetical protein